jgi:hypothetical protein
MSKRKSKHPARRSGHRNAGGPPAPRAKRNEAETTLHRLGYTAAGAAATALAGSLLAHEGWAPKTIAGALTAVGAALAWRGDDPMVRSVGAGTMAAAGSQLALMLINDRGDTKPRAPTPQAALPPKRQAEALPPGALEAAFERARARLAMATDEQSSMQPVMG